MENSCPKLVIVGLVGVIESRYHKENVTDGVEDLTYQSIAYRMTSHPNVTTSYPTCAVLAISQIIKRNSTVLYIQILNLAKMSANMRAYPRSCNKNVLGLMKPCVIEQLCSQKPSIEYSTEMEQIFISVGILK